MKLTDLNPRWVGIHNFDPNSIYYIGVSFDSPTTGKRLAILFEPPIDPAGLAARYGWPPFFMNEKKWARQGESFDQLTLAPSIDFSANGDWHGFITKGEVT